MDGGQVSVVDLDQLVQVLGLLYLVLKLQASAVQNLARVNSRLGLDKVLKYLHSLPIRKCTQNPDVDNSCILHSRSSFGFKCLLSG